MALVLAFSLAACGGKEEPDTVTEPETTTTTEAGISDDATQAVTEETATADGGVDADVNADADADVDADVDITTVDATQTEAATNQPETIRPETTRVEKVTAETTANVSAKPMTKAEFAKFLNAETAKIAKSGTYDLVRKASYTRAINIGGATDPINAIIKAIDENSSIDSVIGSFLGMGTTQGKIPKDDINGNYKIKATSLTESDLGSFTASNGVYTFTLAKVSDPKRTNATPFARFTNDFVTQEEVESSIAEYTTAIKVKDTDINYSNIKVTVTVKDGKITDMKYSYDFDAMLAVSVLITVSGDGAAVNNTTYSNIKY